MVRTALGGQPVVRDGLVEVVGRGLACKCRCPECRSPVVARKGNVIRHHFAHIAASRCTGENALHAGLVRYAAAQCKRDGHEARTEYRWRNRRFDVALVRADGSARAAYEIAVTSRKDVTFIREVARAGIRVREAVADPAWLDGVLRQSDTWNEAVATI